MRGRQCLYYGCVLRLSVQVCIDYSMAQYAQIALLCMVKDSNAVHERTNAPTEVSKRGILACNETRQLHHLITSFVIAQFVKWAGTIMLRTNARMHQSTTSECRSEEFLCAMRQGALTLETTCVVKVAILDEQVTPYNMAKVQKPWPACINSKRSIKNIARTVETLSKREVSSNSGQPWPAVNGTTYASAYLSHCRAAIGSQRKPIRGLLCRSLVLSTRG